MAVIPRFGPIGRRACAQDDQIRSGANVNFWSTKLFEFTVVKRPLSLSILLRCPLTFSEGGVRAGKVRRIGWQRFWGLPGERLGAFSSGVLPMSKRRVLAAVGPVFGKIKAHVAVIKASLRTLEARLNAHSIIFSDVFGADAFVEERARAHTRTTSDAGSRRVSRGIVPWHDGLEFEPAQPAKQSAEAREMLVRDAARAGVLPAALDRPRTVPSPGTPEPGHAPAIALRRHLPKLLGACLILLIWISASRSGPLLTVSHSSADAIAEQFSGASDGLAPDSQNAPARWNFAPRFESFYDDLVIDRFCVADNPAGQSFEPLLGADSIVIRNLPSGTLLSTGERMSPTAWRLKPGELDTIAIKVPAGYDQPIQATIETLDHSGGVLGKLAVEIREAPREPRVASQRKLNSITGNKTAAMKRRSNGSGQQLASKPPQTGDLATTSSDISVPKQPLPLLLFLPGPYDKDAALGVTADQQILINLGVPAASPPALAQKN